MSEPTMQELDGMSLSPTEEKLKALREVLPEVFTENQIDWEKLKATLGENINFSNERYVLNWAGKSDAFKVLQVPSSKTLVPAREESVNFDETQNIFIEGENLEALKVLQKSYFGKVKMIYIDPPYNTGNDSFIYPDKFSETKADYEKRVGDKDEEGYMTKDGLFKKNSKENGQYHSNWLNMMMPRLYLAKNLLRQDGVIFVSIDDNEVHNLRLLMNEVFGEENFIGQFIWQSKKGGGSDSTTVVQDHEYVLCYSKNMNFLKIGMIEIIPEPLDKKDEFGSYRRGRELNKWGSNSRRVDRPTMWFPIPGPNCEDVYPIKNDGTEGCWRFGKENMMKFVRERNVEFVRRDDGSYIAYEKIRSEEARFKPFRTLLKDVNATSEGSMTVRDLFDGEKVFSFPKPQSLLRNLITIGSPSFQEDIVLDFFAGSSSTAHAIMELNKEEGRNRKYICVQLPELCEEKSEAFKAGYKTIADISKERIRRAGKKIKSEIDQEIKALADKVKKLEGELPTQETKEDIENLKSQISNLQSQDLGFKVVKLNDSNFKQWKQISGHDAQALAEQIKLFVDPVAESATAESMVYELLLKSGKDLNSRIEKKSDAFWINEKELVLILDKISEDTLKEIIHANPAKVIALDRIFKDNDQLKTNTVLQMRDAGVEFKTI
ncbi:site-specific DNA-methyltransferase [Algoriphagus algorifonticola]|uniref:site-specific DNA-methyltransferase n=1 Tax=Algoriphagus algorifonticola TaxID=2593007 RepID=UPI001C92D6D9|nr:site-specific DNA-methyltransferase [Algoriphagus algorifonticola]